MEFEAGFTQQIINKGVTVMKKILALTMCFILVFSFVGCKDKKDKEENKNTIDIEYFLKLGKIPECDYSLGEKPEKIKEEISASSSDTHEHYFNEVEGEKSVLLEDGSYGYYYLKDKKDKGISFIFSNNKAFGFEIGTLILEVKEALGDIKYTEEPISKDNAFFLLGDYEGSVIEYSVDGYSVMFVFVDNSLISTAIYITSDWK